MGHQLVNPVIEGGEITMEGYLKTLKEFYDAALSCLEVFNKHSEDLSSLTNLPSFG
jgi:hypothetical protein